MSELYERIVNRRSSFERLMARVPGFRDYLERQAQRDADRMIREFVAGEVKKRIHRLVELEREMLRRNLSFLSETREVKSVLQRYHDRIRTATTNFEHIRVSRDDIEKLYNFDEAQLRHLDHFDNALENLMKAISEQTEVSKRIAELQYAADEANGSFSSRETVLTNLAKLV